MTVHAGYFPRSIAAARAKDNSFERRGESSYDFL